MGQAKKEAKEKSTMGKQAAFYKTTTRKSENFFCLLFAIVGKFGRVNLVIYSFPIQITRSRGSFAASPRKKGAKMRNIMRRSYFQLDEGFFSPLARLNGKPSRTGEVRVARSRKRRGK